MSADLAAAVSTPTDVLLCDAIEAETRKVMAQRVQLKRQPGTHGRQADLLVDVDYLLDRWLEVVADDGDATLCRVRLSHPD